VKPSHQKLYDDWHEAERKAMLRDQRIDRDSLIVVYTKGIIAVGLVVIFTWLLWSMTGPRAMAFFYGLAQGVWK